MGDNISALVFKKIDMDILNNHKLLIIFKKIIARAKNYNKSHRIILGASDQATQR